MKCNKFLLLLFIISCLTIDYSIACKKRILLKSKQDISDELNTMKEGEVLMSENKKYRAVLEEGNLIIYSNACCNTEKRDKVIWSSGTANKGQAPRRLIMQADGNLVIYDNLNKPVWASNTDKKGEGPFMVAITNKGELVLSDNKKVILWSTPEDNLDLIADIKYVRVVSGNTEDSWLQISQLVVLDEKGVNVAKGKPASASSRYGSTNPSIAVDGVEESRSYPQIHHSGKPNGEFFEVDLVTGQKIQSVIIYNRKDCCKNRIVGAKVLLLNQNRDVIRESMITSSEEKIIIDIVKTPLKGWNGIRYVRISSANGHDSYLQISQLVVLNEYNVNVSRGKVATSSSNYVNTNPSKAVDGVEHSRSYPSIFHSGGANHEWLMVDLGKPHVVSDVILYNRADCCQSRILGAKIELLDSNKIIVNQSEINYKDSKVSLSHLQKNKRSLSKGSYVSSVRYVKILSGPTYDSWLHISQLVVKDTEGNNLAFNKKTKASSNYKNTDSGRAVDGNLRPRNYPEIFHADAPLNQYLMVDLEGLFDVSQVEIYNRRDCCQTRIVGAKVLLIGTNDEVFREEEIKSFEPHITVNFMVNAVKSLPGIRYVRVLSGKGKDSWLQISQLVVHNEYKVNIARGKSVKASSSYAKTSPSTAVDGNEVHRSYPDIHHAGKPNNEFFLVDLGYEQNVSEVILYNRADCCQQRIIGATVQFLNKDMHVIKEKQITNAGNSIKMMVIE